MTEVGDLAYVRGCQLNALCRLPRYSAKACRPAGVARTHVRGLEPWNSFSMAR